MSLAPAAYRKAVIAFFLLLGASGLVLPDFQLLAFNQYLFLAINVLALNFCLGLGGQISLAQGAFAGLGAYASLILHARFPEASALIIPATTIGVFLLAGLLSLPMEKLGEGFLAMATLGVSLIFTNLVLTFDDLTGGSAGMMTDAPLTLPGIGVIAGDRAYFLVFLGLLALGAYVFLALRNSRLGRALLACKDDPPAAASCGVNRALVRALAFGLGGALSSLSGIAYGHYSGFISPDQFSLELSLKALLFLVIGGPGNLMRPILAALVLETALGRMHFLGDARTLCNGLLLGSALLFGYWRESKGKSLKRVQLPG